MSIAAINWAFKQPLKDSQKFVLVALADYSGKNNQCWPTMDKLAEKCGMAKRTVITHINALVSACYVTREKRWHNSGGQRSNFYTINISATPTLGGIVGTTGVSKSAINECKRAQSMSVETAPIIKKEPPLNSNHHLKATVEDFAHAQSDVLDLSVFEDKKTKQDGFYVATPNGKKFGSENDLKISREIFQRVQVVCPSAREPTWAQWANDVRLMRVQDDRTPEQIRGIFSWANRHPFWSTNILSPKKLRAQWDTLAAQMGSKINNTGINRHNDRDFDKKNYDSGINRPEKVEEWTKG